MQAAGLGHAGVLPGGAVVLPLIQHVGYLSLAVHKVEVCTDKPIVCRDGVPIWITVVVEIKVKGDDQSIAAAAEHLFGKAEEECATIVIDVLMGHIQAMAGTLLPRELIQSLNLFSQRVQEIGICDLAKFGLTIVSLHITDVRENAPFSEAEPLDHILD
jgi:flotillin